MAHQYESTAVRRRQIAEAALEVISEEGLRSFTTRAIAKKVGITDGTIFRHFPNKQAIVLAALEHLESLIFAPPAEVFDDPLKRLKAFFVHRAELIAGSQSIGRLTFSEQLLHAAGVEGRAMVAGWRARSLAKIIETLNEIGELGRLRGELPVADQALVLRGQLLNLCLERSTCDAELPNLEARIESAWRVVQTVLIVPD